MAGFSLLIDTHEPLNSSAADWQDFWQCTAALKDLPETGELVSGRNCLAIKLDAPDSLHRGITTDLESGSWLFAVGTVVDPTAKQADKNLDNLLSDFLKTGTPVFSRLNGQFVIVIYNAKEEKVSIVSDAFGMIPVYYGQKGSRFYFSTSALAIAKTLHSQIDELKVRAFLLYGDTLGGTLWQDVHMLRPATEYSIQNASLVETTYWSFNINPTIANLSLDESVSCIIDTFTDTMRQALRWESKIWVSLTGGLDSRILAAFSEYTGIPFSTYCHGPLDSRDVLISNAISQKMKWEYIYFPLPENWGKERAGWLHRSLGQTDGHLDILKMCRTIREQTVKASDMGVSIWGYGGELYRGYYWKQEFLNVGKSTRVNYDRFLDYRMIPLDCSILDRGDYWNNQIREEFKRQFITIGEHTPDWLNSVKLDLIGLSQERGICGTTIAAVLGQQRVVLPFYYKDNIEKIFSVDYRWRTHSRMFRLVLDRLNPELAKMQTADGGPAAPMQLANMHRFLPYWMNTTEKLLWRLGKKYLGKSLWNQRDAGPQGNAYPIGQWLKDTIIELDDQALIQPDKMISGGLYDSKEMQTILAKILGGAHSSEILIGRILAIEMAMRYVGNGS